MNMADLPDDFSRQSQLKLGFTQAFGIPFDKVTSIEELTSELHDDGMSHYVNQMTNDVYSYDMFKDKWLEKNAKKETVVKRLPKCNVTNMLFDCSTVPKEDRHIWGLD
jgi:hypothetical protein